MNMFAESVGTIAVAAVLLAVVIFIIHRLKKDKAEGKSSCGAGCANCALHGKCHGEKI